MSDLSSRTQASSHPDISAVLRAPETVMLLLGFATLLLLMAAFTAIGMSRMVDVNQRLETITSERIKKGEIVHAMRFASRERTLDLHAMVELPDFFERDEHFLHFNYVGSLFVLSRIALVEMTLSRLEKALLDQQSKLTIVNVEFQEQVADLAMKGRDDEATGILLTEVIPRQDRVLTIFNELIEVQKQSSDRAIQQARAEFVEARNIMFALGALAVLLGITIAYFVIGKIAFYNHRRKQMLLSLDSIAGFPEHNPIAVVEFSEGQNLSYANLSAKKQFPDLEGQGLHHSVFDGLDEIVEGMQQRDELRFEREREVDGRVYAQWISSIENGDIVRIYSFDITDRKQAEAELERTKEHLEELVGERTSALAASNSELESYSYSIAHDLRAPLRSIRGFGQILQEDAAHKLDDEEQEHLDRMINAAGRMAELIDEILQLARLSRVTLSRRTIDLSALAMKITERLSSAEPQCQVKWSLQEGVSVEGDASLLEVVLENYFSNAWKYSNRKTCREIEFGAYDEDGNRVVFVKDNGAGFSMEYASKLFVLFQRLHDASQFGGSGVGLASVSRIIQRHGGRVWAEGKVDEGASFYFSLPIRVS